MPVRMSIPYLQTVMRAKNLPIGTRDEMLAHLGNHLCILKRFGNIMRKLTYIILFCKRLEEERIRHRLAMHAMIQHLPLIELRAQIYTKANMMPVNRSKAKEDMLKSFKKDTYKEAFYRRERENLIALGIFDPQVQTAELNRRWMAVGSIRIISLPH